MSANLKNSAVATGLEKVSFHSNPKKGNAKECSDYHTIAHISSISKLMLKIPQARRQQYVNWELPDVQVGFRKGRGTGDQIANIRWIFEKARHLLTSLAMLNLWLCGTQQTMENSYRDGNTRLPYLIPEKSIYRSKATVRTRHGTTDWFQIRKGVRQGCILSSCLFHFYAEYNMQSAGMDEYKLESRFLGEI